MLTVIFETFVPLLSLFIFVLGSGLFSTLLSLKMAIYNADSLSIGAMMGVYYGGLVLGSFRFERFITRVGHIRAYSAFSAILAIVCLMHAIFYSLGLWLVLRFIAGIASAGLFIVIESWLLCKSTPVNRGQVLSLYMITFYAGQSLGQLLLRVGDSETYILFALASMLCSLSIIPVAMSNVSTPQYNEPSTLSLHKLINNAASGLLGCLSSGLIMGGIYGLLPIIFNELFHSQEAVGNFMFAVIFGGMLLQYPVGKLSDIIERRLVLIIISIATILVSLFLMVSSANQPGILFLLLMIFGGLTFTLYPISISHACDALESKDIVAGTQSLLLAYSIGAMVGPSIVPIFLHFLGAKGFFIYISAVCGFAIPLFILRKAQKAATPQEEAFISIPQTTPIVSALDPRGEG